jgi:hypothetical protein
VPNYGGTSDWRIPPQYNFRGELTSSDNKISWLREALGEAENYQRTQRSYVDMDRALDVVAGVSPADTRQARTLSGVRVNRAKRNVRELVATLSNLRPMWGYKNDNHAFDKQALILNKMVNAWWLNTFADRAIRKALQYAFVMGSGYVSPIWRKDFWSHGRGDIHLNVYGSRDVLFIQLPADHNIQGAYAVSIRIRTPIHIAHMMWPEQADKLKPTYMASGSLKRGMGRVSGFVTPILRRFGLGNARKEEDDTPFPMVDIYHTYIMDSTLNMGPDPRVMGDPDTNWSYTVPVFNSDIPTGLADAQGNKTFRKATRQDAMLYPNRRLFIASPDNNVELGDGPSPWWIQGVPLVQFNIDDWPWEVNGYSAMRDMAPIQASNNGLMRAIDDSANARLRPNVFYDMDVLAKTLMDDFDFRQGGQAIPVKMQMIETPIKAVLDPKHYDVPAYITEWIKAQEFRMDHVAGVPDVSAIARAKQIPTSETFDKVMEMAGPLVTDMGRNMESSLSQLGQMWMALFFQFIAITPRTVQVLGPDGVTEASFDYEPGNMLPSHLPGEDQNVASPTPILDRAKWHMQNFIFHVTPGTLHNITQMAKKMMNLQLFRASGLPFPMDPWTLAESMDMNIGPTPQGATNQFERWVHWMKLVQQLMPQKQGQKGRPPSGNAPPHQVQKGGVGGRSTVVESK